jgi:hypothetical protein
VAWFGQIGHLPANNNYQLATIQYHPITLGDPFTNNFCGDAAAIKDFSLGPTAGPTSIHRVFAADVCRDVVHEQSFSAAKAGAEG